MLPSKNEGSNRHRLWCSTGTKSTEYILPQTTQKVNINPLNEGGLFSEVLQLRSFYFRVFSHYQKSKFTSQKSKISRLENSNFYFPERSGLYEFCVVLCCATGGITQ